ncbi:histidine phosphatase family protein [Paenibacillus chondroitinus]|uniref:Histidine phosphatase family protein n=1 Tax=Paenibacillus chondroitinus TaxID=59842 RepID=A0ABU6DL38_9BACL|nr:MULTISPECIES: histidine phosphatase family protein [Paenibacillus]MCY9657208.1 histidine phosphatase family protein [Paenibacillus anseongense]MEB4798491.1 histidine phosphatase family protein [Paenibacillus chondroitinus]
MTTIGFIRHGSTEWNRLGKLQGQLDTDLTDEGREQARLLGIRLASESWDGIISSDLKRAKETAQIVSQLSGIPIIGTDSRLRERRYGQVEGTTAAEREERWGPEWKLQDLGQESDDDLWKRWSELENELLAAYPKQKILLVSHGGFIVQVLRVLRMDSEQFLQNTSLTILLRQEKGWELQLYNCLSHLEIVHE